MARELSLVSSADDDENDETNDALQTFLGEMGEDAAKVIIFRNQPRDKSGYVATWEIGNVTLDRLAQEYGPGEYRLRVQNSSGQTIKGGSRTVKISGDAKPSTPVAQPSKPEIGIAEIIGMLNTSADKSTNMMLAMMQSQAQQSQATMQMLATVMAAAMGKPSGAIDGPAIVAMLGSMKSLVAQPPSDSNNSVEALLKGVTLARELGGDGGGEGGGTDFMGLAARGMDLVSTAIRAGATTKNVTPAANPKRRPPRPVQVTVKDDPTPSSPESSTATPPPAAGESTVPQQQKFDQLAWLRREVAFLVKQAARENQPEVYAVVFLDNLPTQVTEEVVEKEFSSDDALARLAMVDLRVNEYRGWFEEFRLAVLDQLNGEDSEDDDGDENPDEGEDDGSE